MTRRLRRAALPVGVQLPRRRVVARGSGRGRGGARATTRWRSAIATALYGAPRFFARRARRACGRWSAPRSRSAAPRRCCCWSRIARGYQNLCRLLTAAKAGGPRTRAPPATEQLAEHAGGLIALAGAAPRADLPALLRRLRRATALRRAAAPPRRRRGAPQPRAPLAQATALRRRAWSPPTTSATPRRERGGVHDVLTCARDEDHRRRDRPAPAAERRALPQAAGRDGGAVPRSPRGRARHARRSPSAAPSRWPTSGYALPATTRAARARREQSYLGSDDLAGAAPLRALATDHCRRCAGQLDARAGAHREAGAGRLLPGGLGHRPVRARAAASWCRGAARRRTRAVCYALGITAVDPVRHGAAVRALPVRGARAAAPATPPIACPTSIWICRRAIGARR